MSFRPLFDRILIRRVDSQERTPGGLFLPESAKEKPLQGEVLAVGNGSRNDRGELRPLDVKVGDRILFGKYAGDEIKIKGEEFLILREEDVLAVME